MFRVCVLTSVIRLTTSKLNGARSWITQITKSNLKVCLGLYPMQRRCLSWSLYLGENSRADFETHSFHYCYLGASFLAIQFFLKRNNILILVPWLPNQKNENFFFPIGLLVSDPSPFSICNCPIFSSWQFSLMSFFPFKQTLSWWVYSGGPLEYWSLNLLICGIESSPCFHSETICVFGR